MSDLTPKIVTLLVILSVACGRTDETDGRRAGGTDQSEQQLQEIVLPPLEDLEPELATELQAAFEKIDSDEVDTAVARAAAYGELGILCQSHNLRPTARSCYRNAETLDPAEFRWPYLIGHCERVDGNLEEAVPAFRRALSIRPDYLPALVQAAEIELDLGRHPEAEELFRRALDLDPSCASAMVGLARVSSARGDHRAAADHLEKALALQPRATALHYNLALAYQALDQTEQAEAHMLLRGENRVGTPDPVLRAVMERNHSTRILVDRGRAAAGAGSWTQAEGLLREAISRDPEQVTAHLLLGLTLDQLGRPSESLAHYQTALALDAENPRTHYGIGLLHAREGSDADAAGHFRRALELDPGLKQARRELARALERSGETAQALAEYATLLADDPLNAASRLRSVVCLIRLGKHTEARDRLEKDITEFSDESAFSHMLVRLLAASPDDAVRDGTRATSLIERLSTRLQNAAFAETIAMVLAENARFSEARQWQQRAVEMVERAGRADLLRRMRARLALYSSRQPCRQPWDPEDPLFFPLPEPRAAADGA